MLRHYCHYYSMKIALFNVIGVLSPVKIGKILSKLKAIAEVVFLQETHLNNAEHSKLNKMGFKEVYFASYKSVQKKRSGHTHI